jgi:hypothetical protein
MEYVIGFSIGAFVTFFALWICDLPLYRTSKKILAQSKEMMEEQNKLFHEINSAIKAITPGEINQILESGNQEKAEA